MRIYFFGDIHGNGYALERCLAHLDEVKADQVYCLGDLVGWLPFGDRTLRRMRALDLPTVAGNHDLLVAGVFADHPEQRDRMQATAYNAGLLSTYPGAIDYLRGLPLALEGDDFTVVHHSPFDLPAPEQAATIACFDYLDEAALNRSMTSWRRYPKRLIFSGHDHVPAIFELLDHGVPELRTHRPEVASSLTLKLQPQARYWVKVGSVGGPYRDNTAAANTALYDVDMDTITLFRLCYPTQALCSDLEAHPFLSNLTTLQRYRQLLKQPVAPAIGSAC
jgi:predicted phosphodiesterase